MRVNRRGVSEPRPDGPQSRPAAGDALPQRCQVIEVRVAELRQLFNAIDPSPFRERDLDSTMPVRIEYEETAPADAWRSDWPEVAPAEKRTG